ncbi:uncharacterized protein LOC115714473 isoform X4 [Cannabis sativa]|uniref:uncharacterized protein LOC115714473 isoform X4 n=1 Tax=Cannabis sativa TaxID=3483 RepID=UPI0029CA5F5C|nr:uncharacterized protein LOC115714473 isoform X4 [Cannabis sativa]XP_060970542.1 uncharacterized protein LOC115714473 isoform X4 [Cannabis sativa]
MLRFKLKNLLKGILNYLRISRKILKVMGGLLIVSIWIFPPSSLSLAEKGLRELSGVNVELKNLDPLVHRAIAATSVVPDLRDRYDKIPTSIESKLLPFSCVNCGEK